MPRRAKQSDGTPSHWEGRPKAGEGELNCTIAAYSPPTPRFPHASLGYPSGRVTVLDEFRV